MLKEIILGFWVMAIVFFAVNAIYAIFESPHDKKIHYTSAAMLFVFCLGLVWSLAYLAYC